MEGLAAGKWAIELFLSGFGMWRSRRDPVHRQAQRLLDLFEAHGVPRQQIVRLLPTDLAVPVQAFSTASSLRPHMSLRMMDWAASTLAIRRNWLDLVSEVPHEVIDVYKRPARIVEWLRQRNEATEGRVSLIYVVSESSWLDPSEACGAFSVVHEECFADLDNAALSRYRFLSRGWNFNHSPCSSNLLALITVAERFGIPTIGLIGGRDTIKNAEDGLLLVPPYLAKCNERWQVQDWVPVQYRLDNCTSAGHRQCWQDTLDLLEGSGLSTDVASAIQ